MKKNSDSEIISEYPGAAAEKEFRKMVFSPEALATAMTGGTLHYPRDRSPHRSAPTIEELNDRKCFCKYFYYYKSYFIYVIIIAMFLYEELFLSEKYLELRYVFLSI